jgi:hypothetical protein
MSTALCDKEQKDNGNSPGHNPRRSLNVAGDNLAIDGPILFKIWPGGLPKLHSVQNRGMTALFEM